MLRHIALAVAFGFLATSACVAETLLELRSNRKAEVYLDGEFMGRTPLNIEDVEPGSHNVRLVDPVSGRAQRYSFRSPLNSDIRKRINAQFSGARVSRVYEVDEADEYYRGRRIYVNDEGRRYWIDSDGDRVYIDRNRKARVRNVGLGATGLGLVTGSKLLTGAGLGAVIANEAR